MTSQPPAISIADSVQSDGSRSVEAPPTFPPGWKKRLRKSRGTGLRSKSGCITCRKRHRKCDEQRPDCGNCQKICRACVWPDPDSPGAARPPSEGTDRSRLAVHEPESLPLREPEPGPEPEPELDHEVLAGNMNGYAEQQILLDFNHNSMFSPETYQRYNYSPVLETSPDWTADLASARWFNLLTADVGGVTGSLSRINTSTSASVDSGPVHDLNPAGLANSEDNHVHARPRSESVEVWQSEKDLQLTALELSVFQNFVRRCSLWLDLFDPQQSFAAYATRLALRNEGLMKAILALSVQHTIHLNRRHRTETTLDSNQAVQYYHDTLRYVQTALQYTSYTLSEELIATSLIISTYEMMHQSHQEWQRHLKGIFWIQRSQNINGLSKGIRHAVWRAWLRQEVWAAFKERRRCLSYWRDPKDFGDQDQHELADSATLLLREAVNYYAEGGAPEGTDATMGLQEQYRSQRAGQLLALLDRWKSHLGAEYKPLPGPDTGAVFRPIWIHPSRFGAALQISYFARLIILMHRPVSAGFDSYSKLQRELSSVVSMICGIAMALEDEGCQIISSQCLFAAGLSVTDDNQRNEIISLIESCEERSGWPMSALQEDLRKAWSKVDGVGTPNEQQG